jgi:hypothetical protein
LAIRGRLRRAAPTLRKIGIEIAFMREGKNRARTIQITRNQTPQPEEKGNLSSASSASSAANNINDLQRTLAGEAAAESSSAFCSADDQGVDQGETSVRRNPLKNRQMDGADGADDHFPSLSGDTPLCDFCGQSATPANPLNPYNRTGRPDGILLHSRCEGPWFDTRGAS